MVHQIVVLVTPEEFSPVIHSSSRWTWTPTVWNISQSTFNYSILTRHYILIYQLFNRGDILFLKTQILLRTNLKKDYRKITTQIIFTSAGEVFVFVVCQQDFTKKTTTEQISANSIITADEAAKRPAAARVAQLDILRLRTFRDVFVATKTLFCINPKTQSERCDKREVEIEKSCNRPVRTELWFCRNKFSEAAFSTFSLISQGFIYGSWWKISAVFRWPVSMSESNLMWIQNLISGCGLGGNASTLLLEGCRFLKCLWARYWTPNCSWCAGRHLAWQPSM